MPIYVLHCQSFFQRQRERERERDEEERARELTKEWERPQGEKKMERE